MSHTYATLEVSAAAYDEIAQLVRDAGHGDAIQPDGAIDMHGIALLRAPEQSASPAPYRLAFVPPSPLDGLGDRPPSPAVVRMSVDEQAVTTVTLRPGGPVFEPCPNCGQETMGMVIDAPSASGGPFVSFVCGPTCGCGHSWTRPQ